MHFFGIVCVIFTIIFPLCFLIFLFILSIKIEKDKRNDKFGKMTEAHIISKKEIYKNNVFIPFDYD